MPTTKHTFLIRSSSVLRISGADAARYLNGQITQDIASATDTHAAYSAVCNFKGKLQGDFHIRKHESSYLIDTDSSQADSLFARLDQYLIADDAEITDLSAQYHIVHSLDANALDVPCWQAKRLGVEGYDYLIPAELELEIDQQAAEQLRITHAIPRWGTELGDSILPADARLEERAISFNKGCYTGQEVISRMQAAGKTNQSLVQYTSTSPIACPSEIFCDAQPAGHLTSCTPERRGAHFILLGYLKRKFAAQTSFTTTEGKQLTLLLR